MKNGRLWPVASALLVLVAGSVAIEFAVRHREAETLRVQIVDTNVVDSEDSIDGWDTPAVAELSEEQLSARRYALRGDYEQALALYATLHGNAPNSSDLSAEYAHWLARAGQDDEAKALLTNARAGDDENPRVFVELGFVQERLGQIDAALGSFRRALELRPNHSGTRIALGTILRKRSRFDDAIAVLEPASQSGSNEERARALTALGRCYMAQGKLERGRPLLNEAVERAPASVNTWVAAANAYLESDDPKDLDAALAHALRAKKLAPQLGLSHRLLGRIHERRNAEEDARAAYRHSLTLDPNSTIARGRLLRLSLDDDDDKTAREQSQALLKLDPDSSEHEFLAGLVAAHGDRPEQAVLHYQRAIELRQGHYPEASFNLGKVHAKMGATNLALQAYETAIEERPDYPAAWNNLGRAHLDAKNPARALQCFQKALELSPDYALAWHNLARLHYRQKHYDEAAQAYERAMSLKPDDRALVLNLAIALRKAGQEERAIATYRTLLDNNPRYVTAWFNLGVALGAAGRDEEARQVYERALELEPDHTGSLKNLGYLEARAGRTEKARAYLDDALDRDPGDHDTRLKLAELYLRQADRAACRSEAERALAQSGHDPSARAMLARCGN